MDCSDLNLPKPSKYMYAFHHDSNICKEHSPDLPSEPKMTKKTCKCKQPTRNINIFNLVFMMTTYWASECRTPTQA